MIEKPPLRKLLLIDDHVPDLLLGSIWLERAGLCEEVQPLQGGQQALLALQLEREGVDLILLDINMPEMSGFEFLSEMERLAAEERWARTPPVVMLSSSPDPADRARAFKHPSVQAYLSKPLDEQCGRLLLHALAPR